MAWRSHGEDNQSMVQSLHGNNIIQSEAVKNVMIQVDRGHYSKKNAYMVRTADRERLRNGPSMEGGNLVGILLGTQAGSSSMVS